MPRDVDGVFRPARDWVSDRNNGIQPSAERLNEQHQDIADAINEFPLPGDIPRIVDNSTAADDAVPGSIKVMAGDVYVRGPTPEFTLAGGVHAARTDNPHNVTKEQIGLGNVDNTPDATKPVSAAAKQEMDALRSTVLSVVQSVASGSLLYQTRAELYADLSADDKHSAWVISDTTTNYNGVYRKNGAPGFGEWERVLDLPYSIQRINNIGAGTANAIQATTLYPFSTIPYATVGLLNITHENTGAVTLALNGETAKPFIFADTEAIISGALKVGALVLIAYDGTSYRLTYDGQPYAQADLARGYAEAAEASASRIDLGALDAAVLATDQDRIDTQQAKEDAEAALAALEAAQAIAANAWNGTSATAMVPAVGDKAFTTQADKMWIPRQSVVVVSASDPTQWMTGFVLSYTGTTLTITVTDKGGTTSKSDWLISLRGEQGRSGVGDILGGAFDVWRKVPVNLSTTSNGAFDAEMAFTTATGGRFKTAAIPLAQIGVVPATGKKIYVRYPVFYTTGTLYANKVVTDSNPSTGFPFVQLGGYQVTVVVLQSTDTGITVDVGYNTGGSGIIGCPEWSVMGDGVRPQAVMALEQVRAPVAKSNLWPKAMTVSHDAGSGSSVDADGIVTVAPLADVKFRVSGVGLSPGKTYHVIMQPAGGGPTAFPFRTASIEFRNGEMTYTAGPYLARIDGGVLLSVQTPTFDRYSGTSSTSLTPATGSQTLTANTGKSWAAGHSLLVTSSADAAKTMSGTVTSYNSGTGALVLNVTAAAGGAAADWVIGPSDPTWPDATIAFDNRAPDYAGYTAGTLKFRILMTEGADFPDLTAGASVTSDPVAYDGRQIIVTQGPGRIYTSFKGSDYLGSRYIRNVQRRFTDAPLSLKMWDVDIVQACTRSGEAAISVDWDLFQVGGKTLIWQEGYYHEATSSTSLTVGTGAKSLTVPAGTHVEATTGLETTVRLVSASTPGATMSGKVTSYNSGTGALTINVTATTGSGTYADWLLFAVSNDFMGPNPHRAATIDAPNGFERFFVDGVPLAIDGTTEARGCISELLWRYGLYHVLGDRTVSATQLFDVTGSIITNGAERSITHRHRGTCLAPCTISATYVGGANVYRYRSANATQPLIAGTAYLTPDQIAAAGDIVTQDLAPGWGSNVVFAGKKRTVIKGQGLSIEFYTLGTFTHGSAGMILNSTGTGGANTTKVYPDACPARTFAPGDTFDYQVRWRFTMTE